MRRFLAVLHARNKEFIRDRSNLAWNLLFPILVVLGFAFAFSSDSQKVYKISLLAPADSAKEIRDLKYVQLISDLPLETSLGKLKRHQLDMVILQEKNNTYQYWINSSSPQGYFLEKIVSNSVRNATLEKKTVEGKEIRYVDWLISGLLGMNMMFSALFGVGYNIVRYRKNGVLKRLKATPLTAFEFLVAQVASRLMLIAAVSSFIYLGSHSLIHFQMLGSYLDLFIVMALGAMCLISLSLLLASRVSSEEFAGGLLNLISWPMMFLSGVWFSLEGAHPGVKAAAQIFPLTHVIDASRAIMTEGATLSQVATHIIVLATMTIVFLAIGSLTFKWK